jgi:hypothetical protein
MVAVVALARSALAMVAAVRVRLNAMTASTSQAALAVNFPEGRCARAEALRSAWTCSMIAWPRWVRSAVTVSQVGGVGGGEEGVEPPGAEQGALPGGLVLLGVEVGDAAHHQPARNLVGDLLGGERGEGHLGDLSP